MFSNASKNSISKAVSFSFRAFPALLLLTVSAASAQTTPGILTRNYNNQRTGTNLLETILNPSNVTAGQFGKEYFLSVDDQVYAGVLYARSITIGGVKHNVVYVATMNNSIFAFDADKLEPILWSRNFNGTGRPTLNTEVGQACGAGYKDIQGNIGIIGTPVIDGNTQTMYFVSRDVEASGTVQRIHAISIATGNERSGSPQIITASVPGSGDGGSSEIFNPVTQNQRPGLSLSKGVIYISWSSFCDTKPYHGWVMSYDETTLAQLGAFSDTPNGSQGGIWMAGAAPAFDQNGYLYIATGNGTSDQTTDFGESMVKLAPGTLSLMDFFTPSNFNALNNADLDFGSSGPSMVPGTDLLVSGGKQGIMYLLNSTNLGHEENGDVQIPQEFQAVDTTIRPTGTHHIHNASPWWNSPEGLNLYVWGEDDYLHAFRFNPATQLLTLPPFATGSVLPPEGMPGGMISVSANGSQTGTGIVWGTTPLYGSANQSITPGALYAFNAETLALLWSSTGVNDDLLNFSKGSPPVVANGKVFVGTLSNAVAVYGLKPANSAVQDLAYLKTATGSTPCIAAQGPAEAFNGSTSQGLNDKYCSSVANAYLQVDLGANDTIRRFIVEHAGAGGESTSLNTKSFNIQVSTDGVNFTTVTTDTNNTLSISTHDISPTTARYIRLNIVIPTQNSDTTTRIYELQIFGIKG